MTPLVPRAGDVPPAELPPQGGGAALAPSPVDPRASLGVLRAARERLCRAAALPQESDLEGAIDAVITAAWHAGFLRTTACSLVSVVLESELPRRGSRPRRRALIERLVRRARELYDEREAASGEGPL
jgi:hypothetical protein